MAKSPRKSTNKLAGWEVSLIKAMLKHGVYAIQEIQAYFSRPTRTINHARILEIRDNIRHKTSECASAEDLEVFLQSWPQIDWDTGGQLIGDELIIKSREAMIQAVQGYNNPKSYFKTELFIVTAVIAWTYLMHYALARDGIECIYEKDGIKQTTKYGALKKWELETCLKHSSCLLDDAVKANLLFLITIRHEIEHQMTSRIDDTFTTKLQACALNFNTAIKKFAGPQFGLEKELSFSLQFSTITRDQRNTLLKAKGLPANILAMQNDYESKLTADMMRDPRYAYKVAYVEIAANRAGGADEAIQFIKAGSLEGQEITRVLMKETEKPKYKPRQIIDMMRKEGYRGFTLNDHTTLWQLNGAKDRKKNLGVFLKPGDWWWYETWIEIVREHCKKSHPPNVFA